MKKHGISYLLGIALFLLFPVASHGEYITDSWEFNFRTGPGNEYRIQSLVSSGQPVEVLQKGERWTQIRLPDGRQGWVITRALMERAPWEARAKTLEKEKAEILDRYSHFEENWDNLTTRKNELGEQYETTLESLKGLEAEYESLKRGSANYLELKKNYDIVKTAYQEEKEKSAQLEQENKELRSSQTIKWFATGAAVLLCGWLIGLIMGAGRKRQRPGLY